jgi:arylsulfatase A-like enzyme
MTRSNPTPFDMNSGCNFSQDRHWLLRMAPHTLSASTVAKIDEIYRDRLKTLLSVDDLVEKVVLELRRLGLLQRTHLIFTSDHGFHMGKPLHVCRAHAAPKRISLTWKGRRLFLGIAHTLIALALSLSFSCN